MDDYGFDTDWLDGYTKREIDEILRRKLIKKAKRGRNEQKTVDRTAKERFGDRKD